MKVISVIEDEEVVKSRKMAKSTTALGGSHGWLPPKMNSIIKRSQLIAKKVVNSYKQSLMRNLAMVKQNTWFGAAVYQIKVRGKLGSNWSDWFDGISIKAEGAVTTITGDIPDQSALHGLLARIRDLGLPLISVERIESNENV